MDRSYHCLKELISFTKEKEKVDFVVGTDKRKEVQVILQFYSPSLFRYKIVPIREKEKGIDLVSQKKWDRFRLNVEENEDTIRIVTDKLSVNISKDPWEMKVLDREGKIVTQENCDDVDILGSFISLPPGFTLKDNETISIRENMLLFPNERLYGFGEKFTPFDKKGQKIISWTVDTMNTNTEKSYKNIPFFLSTQGYGIFINTTCKIEYDLGVSSSVSYSFTVKDSVLDLYFIYGPKFKDIINLYTDLTGKSPVPPKWSFGLWMSKFGYKNRKEVEEVCERLRKEDIPCDVIQIDPFWMERGKRCALEWDEKSFPSPKEMIRKLKEKGFRVCLWEHPHVPVDTEMFKEGEEKGYFLTREDGSTYVIDNLCLNGGPEDESPFIPGALVDFTNPKAVEWYKEKHRILLKMGVAVFKTDFGEYVPEDAHFYNGLTGKEMRNIYPLLYQKTVFEVTREIKKRGIVWGRSAYAGSQKYPLQWSGDSRCNYPSMACNLKAGLGYALCGFPFWSHDIGGFKGTPSPKLYVRWTQFGMFTSHSRCHGTSSRHPWEFGKEAMDIFRFYVKLRYRLIPYIYSYAYIAHQTGLPILRPMVLEYQEDPNTYDKDLQYIFGKEFLVAPVFNESGEVSVYLPQGEWIDYWTDEEYEGPKTLRYKADLKTLPLFIKANSIIPMGPEMSYVGEKPLDPITLHLYAIKNASFTLYDDDETVSFKCKREEDRFILNIGESQRTYIIDFHRVAEPENVKKKEKVIPRCGEEQFLQIAEGWYFDDLRKTLRIKIKVKDSEIVEVKDRK